MESLHKYITFPRHFLELWEETDHRMHGVKCNRERILPGKGIKTYGLWDIDLYSGAES